MFHNRCPEGIQEARGSAMVAETDPMKNHDPKSIQMHTRRISDISMISAIAVLVFGISVVPALASSKCFDTVTVDVCAEW